MLFVRSALALRRGLIVSLVGLACGAAASPALAAQPPHPVYVSQGVTIPNDGSVLTGAQQLAVNESDHTLLVANQGAGDVAVFSSSVDPGSNTTVMSPGATIGAGVLSAPYGLAVDQALRRLYISDPGTNTISRYTFTATTPAVYTADPTFTSPALGTGAGQIGDFTASMAVDPTTHDLLVADQGNHRVSRYTATGTFVRSFDGSAGAHGVFAGPQNVAVDADGTVYVAASANSPNAGLILGGELERYSSTGTPLGDAPGLHGTAAVAIGPTAGLLAAAAAGDGDGTYSLTTLLESDAVQSLTGFDPAPFFPAPTSVAVDDGPGGNLYYVGHEFVGGSTPVIVFAGHSVLAPGVTVQDASAVALTSAHVTGTVDAGDAAATASTSAHFEYYTNDASTPTSLPDLTLPAAGPNAVVADLTGLRPNTTYHVQLKAQRNDDPLTDPAITAPTPLAHTFSRVVTFTTPTSGPGITEPAATDVGSGTATLPGTVDPFGLQTSYHFEYGATDAYGSRSPATDAVLGALTAPQPVRTVLAGLSPGTTYHYRLVATNGAGTTFGPDRQLTTDPAAVAAARGYEQVTPVDKGGALMATAIGFTAQGDGSPEDGSALQFSTQGALPGATIGTGIISEYLGERGANGWTQRQLDVPLIPGAGPSKYGTVLSAEILGQQPADLRHSVVDSDLALAPGAVAGEGNIYVQDNATGALRYLSSVSAPTFNNIKTQITGLFASADTSHVYLPDVDGELYELADGHQTLISKTPTGDPMSALSSPLPIDGSQNSFDTMGPISTPSGSAVVYDSGVDGAFLNQGGHVIPISVSERPGDPATPVPTGGSKFSKDGSQAFFLVPGSDPLTTDGGSQPGESIYQYTPDAPAGHHLTYIGGFGAPGTGFPVFVASPDGQTVVYSSADGLWAWRHGQREQLSSVQGGDTPDYKPQPQLSPDGRYFAMLRSAALTDDPIVNNATCRINRGGLQRDGHCQEAYLFDLDAHSVACASCAADRTPPAGDAQFGEPRAINVDDAGELFFDTKTRLVSADVNADSDVYVYRDGRVRLVSRGTVGTHAVMQGASASGRDVFLLSDDRLVSQDTDNAIDLYDARLGGGFAAQNPTVNNTAPCAGTECHEPGGGGATAAPAAPTESTIPPSQSSLRPVRARVSAAKVVVGPTKVRLSVRASSRGDLRISGHYLTTLKRPIAAAGTYTVTVSLSHAAQRLHRAHHRLRVGVRISLTPAFGAAAVSTSTRTLRG
jgi:hypothetical protein